MKDKQPQKKKTKKEKTKKKNHLYTRKPWKEKTNY